LVVIPPDSPKLTQIRVEQVQITEMRTGEITAPGKVEANSDRISRVTVPVAGRIVRVNVKLGDSVGPGQALLAIESPDADAAVSSFLQSQAAVTQANATLTQTNVALAKAQADYDRTADLFAHEATAKKEVLNAEAVLKQSKAAVEQANAGVEQAKAQREQARKRLQTLGLKEGEAKQQVTVRSPLAGKVLELTVVAGEYRNDTSAPVMTVADLRTVWVTSDVPENSVRLVRVGEPVDIALDAFPGETFRGRVARLSDTLDPKTRTAKAVITLDNSRGRFRPEMFGRITLSASTSREPAVPIGAVIQDGERSIVCVQQGPGKFQWREVKTGNRSGDLIAITDGLSVSDRVVTDGAFLLRQ
jgi:cobalt-zinc-cadmium efflux system membrane fusion protein